MTKIWPPKDWPKVAVRLILSQLVAISATFLKIEDTLPGIIKTGYFGTGLIVTGENMALFSKNRQIIPAIKLPVIKIPRQIIPPQYFSKYNF